MPAEYRPMLVANYSLTQACHSCWACFLCWVRPQSLGSIVLVLDRCSLLPGQLCHTPETAELNLVITPCLFNACFLSLLLLGSRKAQSKQNRSAQQSGKWSWMNLSKARSQRFPGGEVLLVLLLLDKILLARVAHPFWDLCNLCPGRQPRCILIRNKEFLWSYCLDIAIWRWEILALSSNWLLRAVGEIGWMYTANWMLHTRKSWMNKGTGWQVL